LLITDNLSQVFHVGSLDFTCFKDLLNCFIDFKNILNHLILWDVNYTQVCTTTTTILTRLEKTDIRLREIAATITSSIKSNNLQLKLQDHIQVSIVSLVPLQARWLWQLLKMVYSPFDHTFWGSIMISNNQKMLTIEITLQNVFWSMGASGSL
jgi:hypothetical protein